MEMKSSCHILSRYKDREINCLGMLDGASKMLSSRSINEELKAPSLKQYLHLTTSFEL